MYVWRDRGRMTSRGEKKRSSPLRMALLVTKWKGNAPGTGFTFVCVDDEVPRPRVLFPAGLVHEGPLEAGRETGAASSSQSRVFDLLDDPRVSLGDNVLGTVPVTAGLRAVNPECGDQRSVLPPSSREGGTPRSETDHGALESMVALTVRVGKDAVLVLESAVTPDGVGGGVGHLGVRPTRSHRRGQRRRPSDDPTPSYASSVQHWSCERHGSVCCARARGQQGDQRDWRDVGSAPRRLALYRLARHSFRVVLAQ